MVLSLMFYALCVGLVLILGSAGLLSVYIMLKLPRLPPGIDSKRQLQWFMFRNGLFMTNMFVKGKFNGKPFLVNSRAGAAAWMKPKPSLVTGSNVRSSVKNFDGVRVRFYEPITGEKTNLPGLIFIHGGGFMVGSADVYDPMSRKIAEVLGGIVISVDYRLAPENPFPAGFDDCMTATKYFFKHSTEFGVDPTRVAICGDSAGGNLTAGVVQELCYKTNERPALQILLYPVMQFLDLKTPSYQKHDAAFGSTGGFLPTSSVAWMAPQYIYGKKDRSLIKALLKDSLRTAAATENPVLKETLSHDLVPSDLKEPSYAEPARGEVEPTAKELWEKFRPSVLDNRIMPLFKEDLTRLPPAYIVTCDYDILRDDGVMYAERLKKAGVEVVLENYAGAIHGLMFFPQFAWGRGARKDLYSRLSKL